METYLMRWYARQREREIAAAVGRRYGRRWRPVYRLGALLIGAGARLQRWSAGEWPGPVTLRPPVGPA